MSIHQQKMVRFTIDMPPSMHRNLKIACAEDGLTMQSCVIKAIEKWYSQRTDRLDEELIAQSQQDMEKEGTISFEEWVKKNVQD